MKIKSARPSPWTFTGLVSAASVPVEIPMFDSLDVGVGFGGRRTAPMKRHETSTIFPCMPTSTYTATQVEVSFVLPTGGSKGATVEMVVLAGEQYLVTINQRAHN